MDRDPHFELEEAQPCLDFASNAATTTTTSAPSADPAAVESSKDLKLGRADKVALRMMRAGSSGVTTSELATGLFIAKYTNATSEARAKGHDYTTEALGTLPNGSATTQHIYYYLGFKGDPAKLKPALAQALNRWKQLRASGAIVYPFERSRS